LTQDQINFIRGLDPQGIDGTISTVLLDKNLANASFETVLKFLVQRLFQEKLYLVQQNIELSNKSFKEN